MSLLHKMKNHTENNDPLIRLMTPMIAGILACVFCLVSMTWAWFTASVDTPTQTIQSAGRSTSVKVYEIISQPEGQNIKINKTPVNPKASEVLSLSDGEQADDGNVIISGEPVVWELSPEKSYEVVMTGSGTATTGYCEVALSHTSSKINTSETKHYTTSAFEKDDTFKFTYNTGGFSGAEGVTETQWKEYVENTTPTLTIASFWGKPAKEEMKELRDKAVLGLAPIPCPEAKAETKVELEGFEAEEGSVISAEEDYKVSLKLKDGYDMPSEVVVNIGGKDYVVSTQVAEASNEAPYYDAASGVLTVPSILLSDGVTVSVKAIATQIPVEETEKKLKEESTEETTEEKTEEKTDNNKTEDNKSADKPSGNYFVADSPTKKEEDGEKDSIKPNNPPAGNGGNDDDNDDDNSESSSNGNDSSSKDESDDEKADVTLNLSQLTINLEETQIPTNADLVLTLSAKEDMELPERIVITLDKTIRDEDVEGKENEDNEEIIEDKTEYIINTDGKDNPKGIEFDAKSGELTISSKLLEGVREIAIADIEENEADKDEEKATLTFEVKNLTFDFADDEIVTDEDVVITFTAGEGYKLPETIVITIDGKEYIIYTSQEDSEKNPEGITFDTETGTLTISKDLLEDAEAITIAAEGVKKEEEKENTDADKKDESEDKDNTGKENESESGGATDKEPESGKDTPGIEDKTDPESGTDAPGGENTETTTPETNPDNNTDGKDNGEDEGKTETSKPDTETTPTTPDTGDNSNTEQDGENAKTEDNEGTTGNGTEENTPDTEGSGDSEIPAEPTEPTTPDDLDEPVVTPETPKTETPDASQPTTGENDGADNTPTESDTNSSKEGTQGDDSSDTTTSTSPSVESNTPASSTPAASETSTTDTGAQASINTSNSPATPTPDTSSNSNTASQASGTTTSSQSKQTTLEE